MIVKIQRHHPISSNMDGPPCLIYNWDRSHLWESDDPLYLELFDEGELKIFYQVAFSDGEPIFVKKLNDQGW